MQHKRRARLIHIITPPQLIIHNTDIMHIPRLSPAAELGSQVQRSVGDAFEDIMRYEAVRGFDDGASAPVACGVGVCDLEAGADAVLVAPARGGDMLGDGGGEVVYCYRYCYGGRRSGAGGADDGRGAEEGEGRVGVEV